MFSWYCFYGEDGFRAYLYLSLFYLIFNSNLRYLRPFDHVLYKNLVLVISRPVIYHCVYTFFNIIWDYFYFQFFLFISILIVEWIGIDLTVSEGVKSVITNTNEDPDVQMLSLKNT